MSATNKCVPPTAATHDEPSKRHDASLERRPREVYRAATRGIDPTTAGRLRKARHNALAQQSRSVHTASRWLVSTGAFAVLALAALMMRQPASRSPDRQLPRAAMISEAPADSDNEFPPDADTAAPGLYQHMDCYGWLASSQGPDSAPTNR